LIQGLQITMWNVSQMYHNVAVTKYDGAKLEKVQFLLIGGGLAAVSAARQIAQCEPQASISIINNEVHPPYDKPPLSKGFITGGTPVRDLAYPGLGELPNLRIWNDVVVGLDPPGHIATLASGPSVAFERCLLATGGRPRRLDIPGTALQGVHMFRTAADAEALRREATPGRRCVIVGAGFIGLELAGSLTQIGLSVHVLEAQESVWPQFGDSHLSAVLRGLCEAHGVIFHLGSIVTELRGATRVSSVLLDSGLEVPCDLVVLCVGIAPNIELAREAGIAVQNGIIVDERFQTSAEHIFAAGDVCNFMDPFAGIQRSVEHWGHAEYSGQAAGRNMADIPTAYALVNYVWSEIFDARIDYAGYHCNCDERVLRGTLGEPGSCIFYLRCRAVAAYCAFNASQRDLGVYNRLVKSAVGVSSGLLADPATNLVGLIRKPDTNLVAER
jgi:3-phenylpropionate/trans-cinnamate dioxygenase ferredoxin reductase component